MTLKINRKRLSQISLSVVGLLFAFSLWTINNELRQHNPSDILPSLTEILSNPLFIAVGCSLGGYLVLTNYDFLAFHYMRYSLLLMQLFLQLLSAMLSVILLALLF